MTASRSYRQQHPRRKHVVDYRYCQFCGPRWMRSDPKYWSGMQRDGWVDTIKYGWVCPDCQAGQHATHLRRLKTREHRPASPDAAPSEERQEALPV